MRFLITVIMLSVLLFNVTNCSEENPVESKPQNRPPEILSLVVEPDIVGPSDSVIVTCEAIDPDGDTLVYDWITTGVVKIKGYNHSWLYHTSENTRVFYAPDSSHATAPLDTFWVQCFARDVKGGSDAELVLFVVKQN